MADRVVEGVAGTAATRPLTGDELAEVRSAAAPGTVAAEVVAAAGGHGGDTRAAARRIPPPSSRVGELFLA
jgi:hypothetical protein